MLNTIKKFFVGISKVSLFLRFFSREKYHLVIKLDAIGDYILFRNFLSPLKKSEKFIGKKFLFVGNILWKSIYEEFDSQFADRVIWVDRNKAKNYRLYRILLLLKINRFPIDLLLQPTSSRDFLVNFISENVKAEKKVSLLGDMVNLSAFEKQKSDAIFDTLIREPSGFSWEREKTNTFFSFIDPLINKVDLELPKQKSKIAKPYICFFIGASESFRSFSIDNLVFILNHLVKNNLGEIYLIGGIREAKLGRELSFIDERIKNYTGKLNLLESISFIGNAKAVLTMDSAGVHMAMATKVEKVFCFSNGNHFSRFIPYPEEYKNLFCFFPPIIQHFYNKNNYLLKESFYNGSTIPIDTINLESAMQTIINQIRN